MKKRVTLTIEQEILKQVDKKVDGYKIKNRSHAIEMLLLNALGTNSLKRAFILAGGKGTRLKPITHEIPKPMLPVQGKPVLEHLLMLFKKHGISNIILSIGHKGDKIRDYFGDGSRFGVKIIYVEEQEPLGTGGPLRLASQFLNSTFVMSNGDELKNIDLMDLYLFHKENNAVATIALTTVEDPSIYGVARLKGKQIVEFMEKPKKEEAPSKLINAGLYILEPSVFKYLKKGKCSIEKDIFPKLAAEGKLYGYSFAGQWFDTGTLDRYEKAIKQWEMID